MNPINIIMKVAKIEDHLSDKEMNDILKEHKDPITFIGEYC